MFKVSVAPGSEVIESLTRQLQQKGVKNGAIVSLIGAVDKSCISNMPKHDAKQDILTEFVEPSELSGTGEIADGKVHIHVVLGREDNSTISGHLHWGRVGTFFVNAYVIPLAQ